MTQRVLRDQMKNPEGPVSLADGSWLVTEMDIAAITHVSADGKERRIIANTGLPNGLTIDKQGGIWVADALWRALVHVTMEGKVTIVSKGSEDNPFLLPNDLCFGPDGMIYMTDTGILLEDFQRVPDPIEAYDLDFDGKVYRIDPGDGKCTVLDRGLRLTNGIAFGPNGTDLFVAETLSGNIYRYPVKTWKRSLHGRVTIKPPKEFGKIAGPDGIAFDEKGNLYSTVLVQGDLTILSPDGTTDSRIRLKGTNPTNVAFDCRGEKRVLVTESSRGELILIDTPYRGLPLYS